MLTIAGCVTKPQPKEVVYPVRSSNPTTYVRVVQKGCPMHTQPSYSSESLFWIRPGEKLVTQKTGENDYMYKVYFTDDYESGYMDQNCFKVPVGGVRYE